MQVKIVWGEGKTLASGGVGAPGRVQGLVLVMGQTIALAAEEAVFESVLIGNVRAPVGLELGELVCAVGIRAE